MVKTVSIIIQNKMGQILTLKNASYKKWHPDKWDIVSGKVEINETPIDAFKRELFEETGITEFVDFKTYDPHEYNDQGKMCLVYLFVCKVNIVKPKLSNEHVDHKWMSISDFFKSDYAIPAKTDLRLAFGIEIDE
jgi:8-oxo-dGTP pyrophosphatase MutT (NUDIX family)